MSLSDAQRAQLTQWLDEHNLVINCPMCADIAWEHTGMVWAVTPDRANGQAQISPTLHPMIQSICTTCGYVRLLSARIIGLEA